MKNGIDVSKWQGHIDWPRVTADFAIIRAGISTSKDVRFEDNYSGATAAGIPVGVYWYLKAMTVEAAHREADACIKAISGKKLSYPVYADIEEAAQLRLGRDKLTAIAAAFLADIEAAGLFAGLYSSKSHLETCFTPEIRERYAVWVAHYGVGQTTYSGRYGMWQHTDKGTVDGISGAVDLDIAYVDYPAVIAASGRNGFAVSPPAPEPEPVGKTVAELADEVLAGAWGNGAERRERLTAAGYDYAAVQAEVNRRVAAPRVHIVRQGDTLSALARKYGTTVAEIVAKNRGRYPRIRADYICIGWKLTV